jgi:hypothetical protein
MTNLHGWRIAGGWPARLSPGPSRRRRSLASHLVEDAPEEADTRESEHARSSAALGVVIVVGVSAALWAAIFGAGYMLLR